MKISDRIKKRTKRLTKPVILESIKERLVELRFNIDDYDIKRGVIKGRRNSLDKIILGLYRRVSIDVDVDEEKGDISVDIFWGGLLSAFMVTAVWFFFISLAILRNMGIKGVLLSLMIALLGITLNVLVFYFMRSRLLRQVKRDLKDLEKHHED